MTPRLYLVCGLPGAGKTTRAIAVRMGVAAELHLMDAPLEELAGRVRQRGGPDAAVLVDKVLLEYSGRFERPDEDEAAAFDRYIGPNAAPKS